MRLILASNNKNKLREFKQLVGMDIELLSQSEAGLHLDVEETGTTFEENAISKAKAVTDAPRLRGGRGRFGSGGRCAERRTGRILGALRPRT